MSDETPSLSTGLFKGLTPEDANGILQAGKRDLLPHPLGGQVLEQAHASRDGVSSLIGSSAGQSGGGSLRTWAKIRHPLPRSVDCHRHFAQRRNR